MDFVSGFHFFKFTKLSGISTLEKSHSLKIREKNLIPSLHNSVIFLYVFPFSLIIYIKFSFLISLPSSIRFSFSAIILIVIYFKAL